MSHSSDRAAVEPLAALVAVFAVTAGVALYAGVLDDTFRGLDTDRNRAAPIADAVERRLSTAGLLDPSGLGGALTAVPDGYTANVTVRGGGHWTAGPRPPSGSDSVTRTVSITAEPGVVRRGRLRVEVWR